MDNIGLLLLNFTMAGTTVWIVYKYWSLFLLKRKRNVAAILTWGAFVVFQMMVVYDYGTGSVWMTIINVALIFLVSVSAYCKAGKIKFFLALLLCAAGALIEMLVYISMSSMPIGQQESNTVGAVLSKLIMIAGIYGISILGRKHERLFIPTKYYMILLAIPMGSIFIAVDEFYDDIYNNYAFFTMITFCILLLFNILIFEIYLKIGKTVVYDREKAVYEQQISGISKSLEAQKKMMEGFHEEKHNLVNELIILKNSVENRDMSYVSDRFERMITKINISEEISNSGNSTVDALINFKNAAVKGHGVEFCLKIHIPEELPIDHCDMGIILGNAIDNAIEAVEKGQVLKKSISISIGVKKEELVIIIENPYEGRLKTDREGKFLTTKGGRGRHGYGLLSIEKTVEKYGGEVTVEIDHNIFILTIFLKLGNFNGISRNFNIR